MLMYGSRQQMRDYLKYSRISSIQLQEKYRPLTTWRQNVEENMRIRNTGDWENIPGS